MWQVVFAYVFIQGMLVHSYIYGFLDGPSQKQNNQITTSALQHLCLHEVPRNKLKYKLY